MITLLAVFSFNQAVLPKRIAEPFPLNAVRLLPSPFETAHGLTSKYLLELDIDRLLAGFRENSGIKTESRNYGSWESGGLSGHSLGHYLTACAQEFARSGDVRYKERITKVVTGLADCQKARGDGFLMAFRFNNGFDRAKLDQTWQDVAAGNIRSGGFDLNGMWSPWYVHHKVFAGLLDAHSLAGDKRALEVARKFGDWAIQITSKLDGAQWERMLGCEYGGMNESLAELYLRTKETKYLELARKFYDKRVMDPLGEGKDELAGKHSNTQIPKLIGMARLYEATGNRKDRQMAEFFWNTVVDNHTYAIGGNSNGEYLGPAGKLSERLSSNTAETCNTYNMLRLTRHLFSWNPQAKQMDYYEQAYLNHILASQDPETGGVTYFMPLGTGSRREYSDKFNNFTCCHGTGMENHTKHGDSAYFHAGGKTLWVNLFMPSELDWKEAKTRIRQETNFPLDGKVTLSIPSGGGTFELKVRHPGWATGAIDYVVNGKKVASSRMSGSYVSISRTWKKGDRLEFRLPLALREIPMPDNPNRVALAYGPTVLAADLAPARSPAPRIPVLVTNGKPIAEWLKPAGKPGEFAVAEAARPLPLRFLPFYKLHRNRYGVYFDKFTQSEWDAAEAAYRAEEARLKDLEARTVDHFVIGQMQPERDHKLRSERNDVRDVNGQNIRTAMAGGWFDFAVKVDPVQDNVLVMTFWGNDRIAPDFEVLVDGVVVASETLDKRPQNKFFDVEYTIPSALTKGNATVVVKIQPKAGKSGPSVTGARIARRG